MPKLKSCVLGMLTVPWLAPSAHGDSNLHLVQEPVPSAKYAPDTLPAADPVARLQAELDEGTVQLQYDSLFGYLPGLLRALGIPVSSQTLVFSRTSLQTDRIAPWAPRALYFSDDVYIGYVQESGFLEVASVHPTEGGVFYTLDQKRTDLPRFLQETTTCLMCHESRTMTGGVPGFMMRSVLTDRLGYPLTNVHQASTRDATPMAQRWGGWYVTGTHGSAVHAGNVTAPDLVHEVADKRRYLAEVDLGAGANTTRLSGQFDPGPYLSPHSDIVALLVLAHQVQVHNLIALAHSTTAEALRLQRAMRSSGRSTVPADSLSPAALTRMEGVADRLVRSLLFAGEAPLDGPIRGTSGFAEEWSRRGPSDAQGRSLRDLDLESRLFRYPLSFLVYSDAFQALPAPMLALVYERIASVLDPADRTGDFDHLDPADRTAIREILEATLPSWTGRESRQ